MTDKERAKADFDAYIQEHGLQDHIEFAKAFKEVFGQPKSYRLKHNGQVIWPPQKRARRSEE